MGRRAFRASMRARAAPIRTVPIVCLCASSVDGILAAGKPQRVAVGLADADGLLLDRHPRPAHVPGGDDRRQGDRVAASPSIVTPRDCRGRTTRSSLDIAEAGTYGIVTTVDGIEVHTAFSIVEPDKVPIPQPGDQMVPVVTPTTADASRRDPDLHAGTRVPISMTSRSPTRSARGSPWRSSSRRRPIARPRRAGRCSTCSSARDQSSVTGCKMVHAEVYTDSSLANTTEAVQDYRLSFEPVLYLAGADGVIADAPRQHLRRERAA